MVNAVYVPQSNQTWAWSNPSAVSIPGYTPGAGSGGGGGGETPVSAANFASASLRGFQTFSDDLSLQQFGAIDSANTSGDGSVTLVSNPDTGHTRDQLLRINSGTGHAFLALRFRYLAHNAPAVLANSLTSVASGHVRISGCIPSGQGDLLSLYSGDGGSGTIQTGTPPVVIGRVESGGSSRLTLNGTPIGRTLSRTTYLDIRVSFTASTGALTISTKVRGEGSYTDESSTPVSSFSNITSFRIGDFYLDDYATSNSSASEIDRHWYIAGSGCRDVRQTAAKMVLVIPDNLFLNQNKARLRYAAGADPTSGTTTTAVALSGAVDNALVLDITGLTHNTAYSYQFQILDASNNVLWTSEIYLFHTLANAGTAAAKEYLIKSCDIGTPLAHPYDGEQYSLDTLTQSAFRGTLHVGDQHYEQGGPEVVTEPYLLTRNPVSRDDFQRQLREFYSDIVQHQLFLKGMVLLTPDDHQFINDGNGTMASGGINESTLANAWPDKRGTYPSGTTCGDLYTNGLATFRSHAPIISEPDSTAYYRSFVDGTTFYIVLDTRTKRLIGSGIATPKYIGTTQMTWVKNEINNIPVGVTEVVFIGQSAFNQFTSKNSEGWKRLAQTEFEEFVDYCIANIAPGINFGFATGDDHLGACFHDALSTTANPTAPSNYLGELRASGSHAAYFDPSSYYNGAQAANVLWKPLLPSSMDLSGSTPMLRCSGVLLSDDGAGNLVAKFKAGGAAPSSYTIYGQPPFPLNVANLVEYWDSNDNNTVFSDTGATTQAVANSDVAALIAGQKSSTRTLQNGSTAPNYVTDGATNNAKVLDFSASTPTQLRSTTSAVLNAFNGNDTSFVVTMRFKVGATGTDQALWGASSNSTTVDTNLQLRMTSTGQLAFIGRDNANSTLTVTTTGISSLTTGSYHTVTLVRNGTAVSIYLDGTVTSVNATTFNLGTITVNEFVVGARYNDNTNAYVTGFDGLALPPGIFTQNSRDTNVTDFEALLEGIWA